MLPIRLSHSHDNGRLIQLDSGKFLSFFKIECFFFNFVLQHFSDWELSFMIFFLFFFYGIITISWLELQIWLSEVNIGWSNMFSSKYLEKKISLSISLSQYKKKRYCSLCIKFWIYDTKKFLVENKHVSNALVFFCNAKKIDLTCSAVQVIDLV